MNMTALFHIVILRSKEKQQTIRSTSADDGLKYLDRVIYYYDRDNMSKPTAGSLTDEIYAQARRHLE
jgi:hypothetical protein